MIKSLKIENFQSHPFTEVEFAEGVTAFVGESTHGKSAILRALKLLWYNKPNNISYISHWAKFTRVTVDQNDSIIERYRDKKDNNYTINGEKLSAIGTNVPDKVLNVINMGDINFQSQSESNYLLPGTMSGGKLASAINDLTQLEQAEEMSRKIASQLKGFNGELSAIDEQIKEQQAIVNSLSFLLEYEETLNRYKQNVEKLDKGVQEIEKLRDIITKHDSVVIPKLSIDVKVLQNLENNLHKYNENMQIINKIRTLLRDFENITIPVKKVLDFDEISGRISKYKENIAEINRIKRLVDSYNSIDIPVKIDYAFGGISKRIEEYNQNKTKLIKMKQLLESFKQHHLLCQTLEKEAIESKNDFDTKMKELGKCPLCGK